MLSPADRFRLSPIAAVDVIGYGAESDLRQKRIQADLLVILEDAGVRAGLDRPRWRRQAGGDGELAVLPLDPDNVEPRLIDDFTRKLAVVLREHNAGARSLRLRVAYHTGLTCVADNGYAGEGPVVVSRLLDADPLKNALRTVPAADLGLIISATLFRTWVERGHTDLPATAFRQVRVVKKEFDQPAWIHLPGQDLSVLDLENGAYSDRGVSAERGPGQPSSSGTAGGHPTVSTTVNGDVNAPHAVFGIAYR